MHVPVDDEPGKRTPSAPANVPKANMLTRARERARAATAGRSGCGSPIVFVRVPMPSTSRRTSSPGCSGGGSLAWLRPHSSNRQPLPHVPLPMTSPGAIQAPRAAKCTSSSKLHAMDASVSLPSSSPLTDAVMLEVEPVAVAVGLELVRGDDPRAEGVGEVLGLVEAERQPRLPRCDVPLRPVVEDRVTRDVRRPPPRRAHCARDGRRWRRPPARGRGRCSRAAARSRRPVPSSRAGWRSRTPGPRTRRPAPWRPGPRSTSPRPRRAARRPRSRGPRPARSGRAGARRRARSGSPASPMAPADGVE